MQLRHHGFYLIVCCIFLVLMGLRIYNFREQFRFISDNGLEYAISRQIALDRCRPLVGPALSIRDVYTPPTYFYLHYLFGGYTLAPILTGYASSLFQILTILFLASTVWLVTNKRFFIISIITLGSSWLLFDFTRLVWHPYPTNVFLSISIFLLTYAKLRHSWRSLVGSLVFYWLAASIYPSPLLLLPWYLFELIRWPKPPQRQSWQHFVLGIGILIVTAMPFYLPQLIFELQRQWPTLQSLVRVVTQPALQDAPVTQSSLQEIFTFMMVSILHLRWDWPGFELATWLVILSLVVLGVASILAQSHRWQLYFPYLPLLVLLAQQWILDHILPGQLHQHWLNLFFIILIPSVFEAAFKLRKSLMLSALSLALCLVFTIHNLGYFWESITAPHANNDHWLPKVRRMEQLQAFWLNRGVRPKDILLLDHTGSATTYSAVFKLQYEAMDDWTLLHYQTLLPPISTACNEYIFLLENEVQQQAKNIFILEKKSETPSPNLLFGTFSKKFSFDLDKTVQVTWYINSSLVDAETVDAVE